MLQTLQTCNLHVVRVSNLRVKRGHKKDGGVGSTLPHLRPIPLGLGLRTMMTNKFATIYTLYGIPYRTSLNYHPINIDILKSQISNIYHKGICKYRLVGSQQIQATIVFGGLPINYMTLLYARILLVEFVEG